MGRGTEQLAQEDGFTIVEVMVACMLLVVGMLGLLEMVNTANRGTLRTQAREQATAVARDVVERTRQVPYASLTNSGAATALAARLPEAPAVTSSTFSVQRRDVTYTTRITACIVDDPTDGVGPVNGACTGVTGGTTTVPGSGTSGAVNVGLSIGGQPLAGPQLKGQLVSTVCSITGSGSNPLTSLVRGTSQQLLAQVQAGASLEVCPDGTSSVALDFNPDDLRRVTVDVTWTRGGQSGSVQQTTLIPSPRSV